MDNNEAMQKALNMVASPEDWQQMQGGKPELWLHHAILNPHDWSDGLLGVKIVHVYDRSFEDKNLPDHHGLVVPTMPQNFIQSIRKPHVFELKKRRLIKVPATMLAEYHGLECEQTSRSVSSNEDTSYDRIHNAEQYKNSTGAWMNQGFQLFRLGVTAVGNYMPRAL